MTGYVANTDFDWYRFLANRSNVEETNFWRPLGSTAFRVLDVGEPFFFKLKARHGSKIAGFGTFVLNVNLPVAEAWTVFGEDNGVRSEMEMWSRVGHYVKKL